MDFKSDLRFKGISPFPDKVWLSSPTMHGEEQRWADEAIQTNWVSSVGENIDEAEREISRIVGCKYAVALSTGTAALHLSVKLAGEQLYGRARPNTGTLAGKKVFCSDVTFDASINPVAYENGEAVFIDTSPDDWNMDPSALEKAFEIYPDTRLVVIAHLYGTPGKLEEIRSICDAHNALIVEDAAESLGAEYFFPSSSPYYKKFVKEGRYQDIHNPKMGETGIWVETGTLGHYNAVSFNGNKIITGSSGGMFLTNRKEDADKVRKWSTQSREAAPWYQHEEIGYNYRMSNIVAGIVRGQISYLREHIEQKRVVYERYKAGLADLPVKMNPYDEKRSVPNFWLSCMLIDEDSLAPHVRDDRNELWTHMPGKSSPGEILAAISAFGAEGRPIWKPMHMQPIYRTAPFITAEVSSRGQRNAYMARGAVDVGADIFRRGLCLPSDNKMTEEQQDTVIEIIHRCFQ